MKYMKKHGGIHTMKKGGMYDAIMKFMGGGNMEYMREGGTDFGNLSVKAGIDKNPEVTYADKIAGATMNEKKEGGRMYRMGGVNEMGHGGVHKYPHGGVHNDKITNNQAQNSARQSLADQAGGGRNIQVISKDRSYGGEGLESLRQGDDYVVMVDGKPTNMTLDEIRPYIKDDIGIKDAKEINRMYEGIIQKGFGGGVDIENTYSEDDRQGQIKYVTDMMRTMQPKVVNRYAIKDKDGNIVGYSQSEELDKERKAKGFTTEKNADYDPQAYKQLQRGDSYKIGASAFDEVSNARGANNQETVKNLGTMLNAARAGKYVDPRAYNDGKRVVFPAQDRRNDVRSDYAMNKGVGDVTRSAEGDIAKRILAGLAGYGGGASRPASSQELTPAERKLRASLGL